MGHQWRACHHQGCRQWDELGWLVAAVLLAGRLWRRGPSVGQVQRRGRAAAHATIANHCCAKKLFVC